MKKTIFKNHLLITSFFIVLFTVNNVTSQNFSRPNDWKKYRKELILQVGASAFLGDLGGLNKIGTDFSPVDVEFSQTRSAISLAYRYKIKKSLNWHSSFNYLAVSGADNLTAEPFRNNRNLSFKSNIFELATRIELAYFSKKTGNRYAIKKTLARRHKARTWEYTLFAGVAGFYFNPKGRNPLTGEWVKLYPLHTEGQGLPGGPPQYSRFAISIPMGAAARMLINKEWSVGLELNYRKTFTDYIDDVHGTYYDKKALGEAYGPTSVLMADPSKGDIPGATSPNGDGTGAQRGDKNFDSYVSLQVTVGRFFAPKRKKSKLRSKF